MLYIAIYAINSYIQLYIAVYALTAHRKMFLLVVFTLCLKLMDFAYNNTRGYI